MSSKHRGVSILGLAILLSACTGTGAGASGSVPPSAPIAVASLTATAIVPTPSPTDTSTAGPTASPGGGGGGAQPTPGSIDPCTLLRTEEASKLMGKTLSAGVSTTLDPDRVCTFKSGLTEVKVFLAPPAPDAATAQAYWDMARAEVPPELPVKDLTLFDRSAFGAGSAGGVSLSAMFVIDGTNFFEVFCGFPACSQAATVGAAQLIAGRLP